AVVQVDDGEIIWGNEPFNSLMIKFSNIDDLRITEALDDFSLDDLHELATGERMDAVVTFADKTFRVCGGSSRAEGYENYCTLTFIDISREILLDDEIRQSRPVVALLQVDNFEELVKDLSSYDGTFMMANIESCVTRFCEETHAISMRDDERYTLVFEERYLPACIQNRFAVLDEVRKIKNPAGMSATLSVGIGRDGGSYTQNLAYARLAMDMALSRGGDQAVIKNQQTYEFFGGSTREIEKRTKVRSRVIANAMSDLMRNSSMVIAMGHKYSDMDSLGACIGMSCICRKLGIPMKIVFDPRTTSAAVLYQKLLTVAEYQDIFISGERAMELLNDDTLLVITDVSRPGMVDAPQLLTAARRIVVIDHHRRASDYIDYSMVTLHEPYASSTCELISEMMQYILTPGDLLRQEAECMLAGIMLDTKNFTMKTGVRTFEAAAFLRRAGADTIEVKRLFADDMQDYFDRCDIIKTAEKYRAGIAIAYSEKEVPRAIAAQAADELLCIEGIQGSFVVFRFAGSTHISGRSLGKINVQIVLERLGGGGSLMEAGAQPGNRPVADVIEELKASINTYCSEM
ncbi:MAG: DHH family phosphoesterase, partial [Ruminococcaceae bacterium]|nr:DHH family phosphoesterase [Oscillospiraceae bacterium]